MRRTVDRGEHLDAGAVVCGVPWWVQRLLDSLTLFVLTLPAGLLIRGAPRVHALTVGALVLVGLPTVAWYSGLALPSLWDWLGVVLAIGGGVLVNARLHPGARISRASEIPAAH